MPYSLPAAGSERVARHSERGLRRARGRFLAITSIQQISRAYATTGSRFAAYGKAVKPAGSPLPCSELRRGPRTLVSHRYSPVEPARRWRHYAH